MLWRPTSGEPLATPAVCIDNLTRDFDRVRALDGLTLEVPEGCVFGFLGPNGAGKTTTINVLLGLLMPTAGRAEVLGFDTTSAGARVRERCGVLLEDPGSYNNLTAAENMEFYGRVWRLSPSERSERSKRLLSAMGLWDRRNDVVGTWSTGMRRRLGIARAVIHHPQLLFLDEPTAGLDVLAAREVRADLAAMAERSGMTIFLTTHNMTEAEQLCDMVSVIQRGRLVTMGPPDRLTSRDSEVIRIKGAGFGPGTIEGVAAMPGVAATEFVEGQLVVELDGAATGDVVRLLVESGVSVEGVVREQVSLEDAFVDIVEGEA
jgi:ABC-2 type transport system ATP-binding protein